MIGRGELLTCTGKTRHETRSDADRSITRRISPIRPRESGRKLTVYKCQYCDGWHIGGMNGGAPSFAVEFVCAACGETAYAREVHEFCRRCREIIRSALK